MLVISVIVFSTTSSNVNKDPTVNTVDIASASEHTPPPELQKVSHVIPRHKPTLHNENIHTTK